MWECQAYSFIMTKKRGLGLLDPHGVNLLIEFLYTVLFMYTVIRFVSIRAKFGICTVVGLNRTQMPNVALIETKRSTVFLTTWEPLPLLHCKKCTVMSDNLGLQDFFLVTNWTRGLSNKALYRNKHKNVNNLMFSLQVEWQRRNNKHINTAWKNL